MFEKEIKVKGNDYIIRVSDKPNKKYVVWRVSRVQGSPHRLMSAPIHFGDSRYEQYKDLIGYYKEMDHLDTRRRENYRKRHRQTDINNPSSPAFWSWNYLW